MTKQYKKKTLITELVHIYRRKCSNATIKRVLVTVADSLIRVAMYVKPKKSMNSKRVSSLV